MYNSAESPLLAAYILHKCKLDTPSWQLIFNSRTYIGKILGKKITAETYADIDPADVKTLYDMACVNPETSAMAKKLLAEFKNSFHEE